MSFEDVRNILSIAYADGFLDDEEFIILYDYYQPVLLMPTFPDWNFDPFSFDVFDSCDCEAHFRVTKDDFGFYRTHCGFRRVSSAHREQFAVA